MSDANDFEDILRRPLSEKQLVERERILDRFERVLQAGAQPNMEDFLPHDKHLRLAVLLEMIALELAHGANRDPTPHVDDYLKRFGELAPVWNQVREKLAPNPSTLLIQKDGLRAPLAETPSTIGRYRVERLLGQGAFGAVYLAYDEELERKVAIKLPRAQRAAPVNDDAYREEAKIVARLDHPHIAPVYDIGCTQDGLTYIVSKYIEGKDLAQRLSEGRPSFTESAELIAAVALALNYAHQQGLVHRDIKPANVLLDARGKPYVVDFGLALQEEDFGNAAGLIGTVAYMSPEQARGEGHLVDGRSDIFSLGAVLYELLTGKRPFQRESLGELLEQIKTVEARPPRQREDSIPKDLERICLKALSKRATDRYTTAKDLAEDLHLFLGRSALSWMWAGGATALGVLLLLIGFLVFSDGGCGDLPSLPPNGAKAAPLEGAVDVLVYDPNNETRQGLRLFEPGALPLYSMDRIQLEARLSRPAYIYLFWLGSEGDVTPLYPYEPGSWERPEEEKPTDKVHLPKKVDSSWGLKGAQGMETLLLLARETPLPKEKNLASLLEGFMPPEHLAVDQDYDYIYFTEGKPMVKTADDLRSLDLKEEQLDKPLLQLQRRLDDRLRPLFPLVRSISFAHRAK